MYKNNYEYEQPDPGLLTELGISVQYLRFCDRPAMLLVVKQAGSIVHFQAIKYSTFNCKTGRELKAQALQIALNWIERNQTRLAENICLNATQMPLEVAV